MAELVIMPRQGQSVESCIITEWKKKKGDAVKAEEVLFSYETDKSAFDEKSPIDGIILEIFAGEGDDVPCLDPVCVIGREGEDISALVAGAKKQDDAKPAPEQKEAAPEAPAAPAAAPAAAAKPDDGFVRISPRARKLADKTGADISAAVPTGPMGRIIERDINAVLDRGLFAGSTKAEATPAAAAPAAEFEDVKIPNIRKVIARSMHASLSEMAQLTLNSSFDASCILSLRASLKAGGEAAGLNNITINDMILYAVSRTILAHRDVNANYLEKEGVIRYFAHANLGVAVDTPRGLIVPTLFSADTLTLNELSGKAKELIKAAQSGSVSPDLLTGGSFTVTNLGSLGVESFTPVINPPQTAILGVDCVTRRVKQVNGQDVFYDAMGLSLTFDHRALDGAPAAKFLRDLCFNLEHFDLLLVK